MSHLKSASDYEQQEEERLLNILKTSDSHLQLTAFKRLVKIYKRRPESEHIYSFLENHNFNDHETVNFLLECLFEFFGYGESSNDGTKERCSTIMRIEKIYQNEKIMQSLVSLAKCAHAQTNALVVLVQILQIKPCREQWVDDIVGVFYSTRRRSIENLTGKIILLLIRSDHRFSYLSFSLIQHKLSSHVFDEDFTSAENVDGLIFREIKRSWEEDQEFGVVQYMDLLKNNDLCFLVRFANQKFIKEHTSEIDERIDDISESYLNAIQSCEGNKMVILEHMSLLLDHSELFVMQLTKSRFLDVLYGLTDSENKDLAYLSTKIISKILITYHEK
ncbi:uncharacterized protein VICG_01801 [Vittaforma corneae ATCC 50505]|uniref:Uncharacterized protein n=1 Tax=Vittaforma corneae (strain ATCC 50505) TaxID=993615 RepID=L2GLP6_VITCO|nr:uncharacterized protein VICG_01801 [Vittaforma corneae ATCC 50505]ELA41202.1 hypothetical protein VICG_01801 [Vittaforma corneae ATCC 50505]